MRTRTTPIRPDVLRDAADVIKCLGHPLRLRLLDLLEPGETSVSGLVAGTSATQAAVSQQLGILRGRGLVDARREGPRVLYRIADPRVHRILACIRGTADQDDALTREIA